MASPAHRPRIRFRRVVFIVLLAILAVLLIRMAFLVRMIWRTTPVAQAFELLGMELCTAPDCGLTPPAAATP